MNDEHTPDTFPTAGPGPSGETPPDVEHTRPFPESESSTTGPSGPQDARPPYPYAGPGPGPGRPPGQPGGYGPPSHPTPYGGATPAPRQARARVSGWVWPAVCALALLVGLVGGALGGVAVDEWRDASSGPGRSSEGLAGVDTVSDPPLPAENGSVAAVAEQLLPSTVQILADAEGQPLGATGSGFFMDREGRVVTNNHVIASAAENGGDIKVVDSEGTRYDARVVGRSPVYDLAVLVIEDPPEVDPASLGDSSSIRIGEQVVAIGSPLGLSSTVTSGIVSAVDRPVTTGRGDDLASYINAVQTDAAINPGNSGGPLVNLQGQVVGVNSAIATTGSSLGGESGNIGVGFAIPVEQVKVTVDQILKDGEARYPVIGATVTTDESGQGALIDSVEEGSPAAESGLEAGDVVTAVDERQITDSPTLIVAIRTHLPGEEITLTVERDGDEEQLDVTLDSRVG